jgi:hypothetical protein
MIFGLLSQFGKLQITLNATKEEPERLTLKVLLSGECQFSWNISSDNIFDEIKLSTF